MPNKTRISFNETEIEEELEDYNDPLQEVVDLVAYILMPYVIPILFLLPDFALIILAYVGITLFTYTCNPISKIGKNLGDFAQRIKQLYDHSKR